jgi:hypothetical protein
LKVRGERVLEAKMRRKREREREGREGKGETSRKLT